MHRIGSSKHIRRCSTRAPELVASAGGAAEALGLVFGARHQRGVDLLKDDFAGDVFYGEVPNKLEVVPDDPGNLAALEGEGGVFLDVEEVGGAQVRVTLGFAGVDGRGVDGDLGGGVGQ